jgi:hypothetical protein
MTWDEFVEVINKKLAAAGLSGKEPVWDIDVTFPHKPETIQLSKGAGDLGISIRDS